MKSKVPLITEAERAALIAKLDHILSPSPELAITARRTVAGMSAENAIGIGAVVKRVEASAATVADCRAELDAIIALGSAAALNGKHRLVGPLSDAARTEGLRRIAHSEGEIHDLSASLGRLHEAQAAHAEAVGDLGLCLFH